MRHLSLALLFAALLLAACGGQSSQGDIDVDLINNPATADGTDAKAKAAAITFDCDLHDFGRITQGESISYSFHFRNTGTSDLIISGCTATCGCTVADYPRGRIAPGKDGYITVSFNSQGKTGQQYQEVTVSSNAQPSRYILKITAQISY